MNLPFVLFLNGINDQGSVNVLRVSENNHLKFRSGGSSDVFLHIKNFGFEKQMIILDTNQHSLVHMSRKPELIFNEISDADSHRLTLKKASHTLSQLNCPVINHPDLILRTSRDQIYQLLKDIPGLIAPMTLRCVPHSPQAVLEQIETSNLNYPVIVRECGLHNSDATVLLNSPTEIDKLNCFPFDGREFYLIQFIDSQQFGVYSKFRIVLVDGKAYFRHARYYDHWNVNFFACIDFMSKNPQYSQKEIQFLAHFETEMLPYIASQIEAIYQILKLDYFGIDFTLTAENQMQIFEVNSNMHCLNPSGSDTTRHDAIAKINQAVIEMILSRIIAN